MAESHDARCMSSAPQADALSADALYKQGMAHYRRRQWRQAWASFQGLKQADPSCREIDTLLDELDIFIRLESLTSTPSPDEACEPVASSPSPSSHLQTLVGPALARPIWRPLAVAGILLLACLIYGAANPHLVQRMADLRARAQAHQAAGQWNEAINTYERLLLFAPSDWQVRKALSASYDERGQQRAAQAEALEERAQYREAAQQWEMALADFEAARDVARSESGPAPQITLAQQRRHAAGLMDGAIRLAEKGRWIEAIQTLQTLSAEQPGYRTAEVQAHLSYACLQAGNARITSATSPSGVREGIRLIEQARAAQPESAAARIVLAQARIYLWALAGIESEQWNLAVCTLQGLLRANPGYAGGRASDLLCQALMQRAAARYQAGDLRLALDDYEVVANSGCAQQPEAARIAGNIAMALTPTATPTTRPTPTAMPTLSPTPALMVTPTPAQP